MTTIRNGVFETNSSSEHCVTLLKPSEYEEFLNGKRIICIGTEKSYTFGEFAKFIFDNACDFVARTDRLNEYEQEYQDDKIENIANYTKDELEAPMLKNGEFTGYFKKWYHKRYNKKFKYDTQRAYREDLIINKGDWYSEPTLKRIKEILNFCAEQHSYCDDHMSAYGVFDIDGATREEQNFIDFAIRNDTGFIIGKKGLDQLPKWGEPNIQKYKDGSVQIEFTTFG